MRIVGGRYELGEEIGRGGMAQVHAAYDTRLGRRVAVKMLHAGRVGDKVFLSRFRREAQSAAGLTHPNIVAVYDSGEDIVETPNGKELVPYIVMELVEGRTLSQIMHDDGTLTIPDAIGVTEKVLAALGYSHAHGVVHRDIKPGNVMLTAHGDVKVMDFGIAQGGNDATATMTQTQSVVGTAQYLSPEQARGLDVDGRSDLYSAGCLLFELVTGRPPFVGDSPLAIAYQHVGEDPATPSTYNEAISHELDAVILHALIKDRDRRYQSAEDFAADLRAISEGQPLSPGARATVAATHQPTEQINPSAVLGAPLATAALGTEGPLTGATAVSIETTGPMPQVEERRSRLAWLVPLLLLLALLGAGLWWWTSRPEPIATRAVPTLIGKTQAQAKAILDAQGLQGTYTTGANDRTAGEVFEQNPDPGVQQPVNRPVAVVISTGPSSVKVPEVRNVSLDTAKYSLQALGLTVSNVIKVDSATVPEGDVVRSEPGVGQTVPAKSGVSLYVSTGKVSVPNVEGQTQEEATNELGKAHFRVSVKQSETDQVPAGRVLSQDPKDGSLAPGSLVTITIAVAPPAPTSTVTVTTTAPPTTVIVPPTTQPTPVPPSGTGTSTTGTTSALPSQSTTSATATPTGTSRTTSSLPTP